MIAEANHGDWQAWNERWPHIGAGENRCLYTTGTPRTNSQIMHRSYFLDLWEFVADIVPARFCELGSGRGTTSQYLAAHGCDLVLVDLATEAFTLAVANWNEHGMDQPLFVEEDVCDTKLPDADFDGVISVGVLEHFDHPLPVLQESVRLLKPGGLMWHVIVGETEQRKAHADMIRTGYGEARYSQWAKLAGLQNVQARRMPFDGVIALTGER